MTAPNTQGNGVIIDSMVRAHADLRIAMYTMEAMLMGSGMDKESVTLPMENSLSCRNYYNNDHSFEGMFRNGGKIQLTDVLKFGVHWSADRKKAWKMNDGKAKRIKMEEAIAIANRCGPVLEDS
eukprot:CCRYP_002669-RA/>CCRYP_002669-RA protein AED:0.26 eAED:0.27 QI:0/0/0/1/0/0.25/4/0/123